MSSSDEVPDDDDKDKNKSIPSIGKKRSTEDTKNQVGDKRTKLDADSEGSPSKSKQPSITKKPSESFLYQEKQKTANEAKQRRLKDERLARNAITSLAISTPTGIDDANEGDESPDSAKKTNETYATKPKVVTTATKKVKKEKSLVSEDDKKPAAKLESKKLSISLRRSTLEQKSVVDYESESESEIEALGTRQAVVVYPPEVECDSDAQYVCIENEGKCTIIRKAADLIRTQDVFKPLKGKCM